jgi:protoporphyrinogen/coproporphyrinogen III oxidase
MPTVVIVGGGISGLALAFRLQGRLPAATIHLLEQRPRPGGAVQTIAREGFRVEAGPNGFLDNKPFTSDLCRDLGIAGRLTPASESSRKDRYLLLEGRLRKLPTGPLSFLTTDSLTWLGKLELLTERLRPRRTPTGDESVDSFARRRAGRDVAATLVDAFVAGIYAGDPRLLSVHAAFPRLAALEREHGSILAGLAAQRRRRKQAGEAPPGPGRLWSFPEGLAALIDSLADALRTPPLVGVAARSLRRTHSGWEVRADGSERWHADAVVLTCPAHTQAELLADVDPALAGLVGAIPYNSVAVVALGYRASDLPRAPDGFGYLSPQRERRDVLGVQWCSSIFPGRAPPGTVLWRAFCGGWNRPDVVGWPDARLLAAVRAELVRTMHVHATPVFHQIVRWERAIPQYHLGHLQRLARIEQLLGAHPGLFLGGNAYRGVALNDCVEQAALLAERVAAWLAGPRLR